MKAATRDWLNAASTDLKAIVRLEGDQDLTGVLSFHAQQCIEKAFKAVLEEFGESSHKIHNLVTLYAIVSKHASIEVDEDLLDILNKLYIDSRYPGAFGWLPDGLPTLKESQEFAQTAQHVFSALSEILSLIKGPEDRQ